MRVLIDYRPALRQPSGVGEYTHQLVKALLAAFPPDASTPRLELSVFSSSWKDRLDTIDLDGAIAIDRRVPVSLLNLAWHRLGWPPAETLTGSAFDVTHSLHPLLLPARVAAQVVTVHDLNFLTHPERTQAEIRRDYLVLARDHAHRADRVIVPSRFTAIEVERRLGVPAERVSVCSPGAPDWGPRTSAPDDGYVLFLGTLEPRKNVGTLLDAYERLLAAPPSGPSEARGGSKAGHYVGEDGGRHGRNWSVPELVLAGKATAQSRPWLDRIARVPLAGRVRHVGYVDRSKRRPLYEGARLLVQPSFEEGFGIPVLEAMTAGVPVLAANRGALPEVLGDAGLLVDPEDAEQMAAGMKRMIGEAGFAAACAAKGVLRSRQFRWAGTAERVYEAYELAIERRVHRTRPT